MKSAGRPPEKPLQREGRYTYTALMGEAICFPTETATEQDIACIRALNSGYDKRISTDLTTAQHESLVRLLRNHAISVGAWK